MKKFAEVFDADRRQKIQLFLVSITPFLILGGFANEGQVQQGLIISAAVLQFLGAILSLVNVRKGDWSTGWMIVRAAIYALAATVSPALVLLGLYDQETSATLLTGISLALTGLSSGLSIFVGKSQQLEEFKNPTYNGTLFVNENDPLQDTHKLEIDQPWDELGKLDEVRIKVVDTTVPDPLHSNGKD